MPGFDSEGVGRRRAGPVPSRRLPGRKPDHIPGGVHVAGPGAVAGRNRDPPRGRLRFPLDRDRARRLLPADPASRAPPQRGSVCRSPTSQSHFPAASRRRSPFRQTETPLPCRGGDIARPRRSASRTTSSNRGLRSTTVTLVPRAANIEAYSIPITPAPRKRTEGTHFSASTSSESITVWPSNSTVSGRAGRVPTAITLREPLIWRCSP